MNYLCLEENLGNAECVILSDPDRVKHIKDVLKKSRGDTIKITVINHGVTTGLIKSISEDSVTLEVDKNFVKNRFTPKITLAVGACRPLMTKRILEHATTLGVSEFIFFKAYNSEKSYLDSKVLNEENRKKYLIKGLEQTGTFSELPDINIKKSIEDISLNNYDQKIFLHGPGEGFLSLDETLTGNWIVFVGPERGWSDNELRYMREEKLKEVAISQSILRVEFAVQSFMAQLEWVKNARR